jgi:hypothetical protein
MFSKFISIFLSIFYSNSDQRLTKQNDHDFKISWTLRFMISVRNTSSEDRTRDLLRVKQM